MANKLVKIGLDIGNSAVKGSVMNADNGLLKTILQPSCVNYIQDVRQLNYPDKNVRYTQVVNSPLEHSPSVAATGQRAMEIPNYRQFDVGSTSYKTGNELTTSLLFGNIGDVVVSEQKLDVILAVSIPIVESKTYGLVEEYCSQLENMHKMRIYTEEGEREVSVNIVSAQVLNEGQAGFLGLLDTMDAGFRNTMTRLYGALGEQPNMVSTLDDFLVVDIGEGTTDIAVFRNKRFNANFSYSVTKGYGTILELAMSNAEREGITVESRKQLQNLLSSTNARRQGQRDIWNRFMDVERRIYVDEVVSTILKTYGRQSFFDAIIFLGGGFSALTGYSLSDAGKVQMSNSYLFDHLKETLEKNNKSASVIFGVPQPYAQSINNRGLMQVLSSRNVKRK